jgi:6-pyruvoyltetrahydropterin/6-carboxytetrahydropterin synthase
MKLGITDYLDCAHHLPGHPKCGRNHGHTYKVELVITGEAKDGMLIDFADLKRQARELLAEYDHRDWNEFLEFPTVENICELLARRLREHLPFPFLIRVYEGNGKWAEM